MINHLIVSTNPARLKTMLKLYPGAEIFSGTTGPDRSLYRTEYIPKTYQRLAVHGVKQRLDHKTIVLQDDVWLPHGPGFEIMHDEYTAQSQLIIYGQREPSGIVAPKAYSATPMIWKLLAGCWKGEGRISVDWMPVVDEHGLVLDLTQDLGGPPSILR